MPLISVILPVYNSEKYIAEAVQSILDQTFTDFELLIINDASADRTLEILESFTDPRLKVITNPVNLKVVKSLNKGLSLVKGEFIARMDADDIALPERFQKQIEYFSKNKNVDVCSTWVYKFGMRSFIVSPAQKHDDIKASLLFHNVIVHPSVMFRKASFEKYNLQYDETFVNAEDYGLWAQAIDKLTFGTIPQILLHYRIHDENVSVRKLSNWAVIREINFRVFKSFLEKLQIDYTDAELEMSLNMGFRLPKSLSKQDFTKYLQWLESIINANKKSNYFNQKSLNKEVLLQILFLRTRKADTSTGVYYGIILKTLLRNRLLFQFIKLRIKLLFQALVKRVKLLTKLLVLKINCRQ